MNSYIGKLLHLCDPTLPIGGYTHSNGLETYVQLKLVKDDATAEAYVRNMITNNIVYNDAAFVKMAHEATVAGNVNELIVLDQECAALKAPYELRQAGKKLGVRMLKIFNRQLQATIADDFEQAIANQVAEGQYPIVFGMYSALYQIPLHEALYGFLYNATVGMVTNAVKLVPLSQMSGQDIISSMQDVIKDAVPKVVELKRELVGLCNIGFDIRCMQHERLYSRLYMS